MSVSSIVGGQWGDEGKGRIVDYLAQNADLVIRFQGGDNAGHTVVNDMGKFALHIIPSGIFNDETLSIVGAGTVVNFDTMKQELEDIPKELHKNLLIDYRAHLIFPFHCLLDGAEEANKSGNWKVGTTKRGIGPCYSDKAARCGIRAVDILDEDRLRTRLEMLLPRKNRDLEFYNLKTFTVDECMEICARWKKEFGSQIRDTLPIIREAVQEKRNVLMEGQLGIMRDLDWGIYPYTTSSNPTSGGACNTGGISPRSLKHIIGVFKAYSTSVGGGPFCCELFDADGEKLRKIGNEFGATTGRPRRCGWFDAVAADYSNYLNGFTEIAITKLDILDNFDVIKVCTGYKINNEIYHYLPETSLQEKAEPLYEEFPGWKCDTTSVRKWEDLPTNAQIYVKTLGELIGSKVKYVSVGPERDQIIVL